MTTPLVPNMDGRNSTKETNHNLASKICLCLAGQNQRIAPSGQKSSMTITTALLVDKLKFTLNLLNVSKKIRKIFWENWKKVKSWSPLPISPGEVSDAYNNFASFKGTGGDKCPVLPYEMLSSANIKLA